jgi:hypothetical protein
VRFLSELCRFCEDGAPSVLKARGTESGGYQARYIERPDIPLPADRAISISELCRFCEEGSFEHFSARGTERGVDIRHAHTLSSTAAVAIAIRNISICARRARVCPSTLQERSGERIRQAAAPASMRAYARPIQPPSQPPPPPLHLHPLH